MDATQLTEELLERFSASNSAPFLFVGSGLSQRYLGTDNWSGLLKRLASLTNFEYQYYFTKANGNLPEIASLIADDFHEIWWTDDKYAAERAQFGDQLTKKSSPLKLQAAKYVSQHTDLTGVPSSLQEELRLLRSARISGVITTNWDNLLEQLFPDFKVFVGQNEVLFSPTYDIAEIYKIHGSYDRPESLILTAEDYRGFNKRNAYLAAKLLTTFLDHPIVFLGYSLTDENIRSIFNSIVDCLDDERADYLTRRLIFVEYEPNAKEPILTEGVFNLLSRDLRLSLIRAHDFTPVYRALADAEYRISAKLLRQIKEHLYELVKTNDPAEKIAVIDVEDLDDRSDIEIVVGVGIISGLAEKGLEAVNTEDILEDVIMDGSRFNNSAEAFLNKTLNNLFRGNRKFVPVFKYLGLAGALDQHRRPIRSKVPPLVMDNALRDRSEFECSSYRYKREEVAGKTLDEVLEAYGEKAIHYLTLIDHDVHRLEQYIRAKFEESRSWNASVQSSFKKLVCIYDRLKYGPGFPVEPSDEA